MNRRYPNSPCLMAKQIGVDRGTMFYEVRHLLRGMPPERIIGIFAGN